MNTNLAVPDGGAWPVERYDPKQAGLRPAGGKHRTGSGLDLAALLRIVSNWRWLILGAVGPGRRRGNHRHLADHSNLSFLGDARGQSARRSRSWTNNSAIAPPAVSTIGISSRPRSACSRSRSIAERAAQDLNLADNEEYVGTEGDAATRLKVATDRVVAGLDVEAPEEGQLIRFSFDCEIAAAGGRDRQPGRRKLHQFEPAASLRGSAYARNFLERQIAKTRADLERSERQLVAYAQAQGIINTSGRRRMANRLVMPGRFRVNRSSRSTRHWPRQPPGELPPKARIDQASQWGPPPKSMPARRSCGSRVPRSKRNIRTSAR